MARPIVIRASTLALAALILAALGFQAWLLAQGHQRAIDLIATRAAARAQATADQVQSAFVQVDLLLQDLRGHLDADRIRNGGTTIDPHLRERMRERLRGSMARLGMVQWLNVFDANGDPVFSTFDPLPGVRIADRPYFRQLRECGRDELAVSEVLVSRSTGRWAIIASRRLTASDGGFAGIILAALATENLGDMLTAVDQQNWVLALHDRSGRLAAQRPRRSEGIGQQVDAVLLGAGSGLDPRGATLATALGTSGPAIWSAQPVPGLPLSTVAGYSLEHALEQWHRDLRMHLATAALLVAGGVCIHLLHRRNLRAAEELRPREEYFLTLFDASPEAVAVVEGGRVVDANRRYLQLFHVPVGHPVPPWAMAPDIQPDGLATAGKGDRLAAAARTGTSSSTPWRCRRSDGSEFNADISVTAFHHRGRDLLIAVIRDLTQLHALEEKLRQGEKLEAIGQLAGGVAHDFNNMLAAILGSAEAIAARCDEERTHRYLSTIISAAERAGQLTRQLLSFARKGKILSTPVDIHQLLRETATLLERTIDPRVVVTLRLEATTALVIGDPSQLQNAILNLCINALDAMPQGGRLT
ncbi:MAG: PAS domain-containing protein, partial [Caulobacterales bacterium]|nr:PAS domain-containing protein [Caulobacterales bacterium]